MSEAERWKPTNKAPFHVKVLVPGAPTKCKYPYPSSTPCRAPLTPPALVGTLPATGGLSWGGWQGAVHRWGWPTRFSRAALQEAGVSALVCGASGVCVSAGQRCSSREPLPRTGKTKLPGFKLIQCSMSKYKPLQAREVSAPLCGLVEMVVSSSHRDEIFLSSSKAVVQAWLLI